MRIRYPTNIASILQGRRLSFHEHLSYLLISRSNAFPPPPAEDHIAAEHPEFRAYNPADYPPPSPGGATQHHGHHRDRYDDDLGYPSGDTFAGDTRYNAEPRGRAGPEDVSPNLTTDVSVPVVGSAAAAAAVATAAHRHEPATGGWPVSGPRDAHEHELMHDPTDGLGTPRPKVQFDVPSRVEKDSSDSGHASDNDFNDRRRAELNDKARKHAEKEGDTKQYHRRRNDRDNDNDKYKHSHNDRDIDNDKHKHSRYDGTASDSEPLRRRHRRQPRDEDAPSTESDIQLDANDRRRPRRNRDRGAKPSRRRNVSPGSNNSDQTVELPARFDPDGKKMPERGEDPMADKIQDLLGGKGLAGGLFKRLTSEFMGDKKSGGRRKR